MKKLPAIILLSILAVIHSPAKGQHWQRGDHFSMVPMQFITPYNIRSAYTEFDAVMEGTDDSVAPALQKWGQIETFRTIDSTYWYGRTLAHLSDHYQIDGLYFVNPSIGFLFGNHQIYDVEHYKNKTGTWIESIGGGRLLIDNNDSLTARPLTHAGRDIFFMRCPPKYYAPSADAPGPIKELEVIRSGGVKHLFNFDSLKLGPVIFGGLAMQTRTRGLIAINDTNNLTHYLQTVDGGLSWSETVATGGPRGRINFLNVDSVGNYWAGAQGGLYCTTDEGASWNLRFSTSDAISDLAFGTARVGLAAVLNYNGVSNNYLLKTLDSGLHWFRLPFDGYPLRATGFDSTHFAMSGRGSYWETTDGGGPATGFLHFDSAMYSMGVNTYRDTATRLITAYNYGSETLRIVHSTSDTSWASVSPATFNIGPGDSIRLRVKFYTRILTRDDASFDFISDIGDTFQMSVENVANAATIEHQTEFYPPPVLGIDSSFAGSIWLTTWGGGKPHINDINSLRKGLIFDSIGEPSPGSSDYSIVPLYVHLPMGSLGKDSAYFVVVSNSITSPDTVLVWWTVMPQASVRATNSHNAPGFALWPNPGNSESSFISEERVAVRVHDMLGRERESFDALPGHSYPISLPAGAYRVIATTAREETSSQSLILQ